MTSDNNNEDKETSQTRLPPTRSMSTDSTEEFIHPLGGAVRVKKTKPYKVKKGPRSYSKERKPPGRAFSNDLDDYHHSFFHDSGDEGPTLPRRSKRTVEKQKKELSDEEAKKAFEEHMACY